MASSAHDAKNDRKHLRKRAQNAAYSMPGEWYLLPNYPFSMWTGQKPPGFAICDQYGPSLESPLIPLARALFLLDNELLRRVQALERKRVSSADELHKADARSRLSEFAEIKRQWRDIGSCKHQFNQSYLKDRRFVGFWEEGLQSIRKVLGCNEVSRNQDEKRSTFVSILLRYEKLAGSLLAELLHVAGDGVLQEDVIYLIRERWMRLDEVLDWYYNSRSDIQEGTPYPSRSTPNWSVN